MTPKEYYIKQNQMGKCDNITSNPSPDYDQSFYQEIFDLMNGYKLVNVDQRVMLQPTNAELSQLLSMCKTKLILYYTEHPEYIGGVPIDQLTFRIDKMQERLSA